MKNVWQSVLRLHDLIERWLNWGAGIVIIALGSMVVFQVLARIVARAPSGVFEMAEYLLVGTIWLAIAYTQRARGHVRLELFIDMVTGKKRHIIESIYLLIFIITFGIIFIFSVRNTWITARVGDVAGDILEIPLWPSKALIPLGSFFLCLRFIRQLAGHVKAIMIPTAIVEEEAARLDYE